MIVRSAFAVCAGVLLALLASPVLADDHLTVIGGSSPAGFFEVIDHVAELGGFFKEEHLIVDKQYMTAAGAAAQLVGSGKAEVYSGSVEPILLGYSKGLRLQMFLGGDPQYDYVLGVPVDSPIKSLEDFKGKEIGEIIGGSAAEISLQSMLAGVGLSKSDYSVVSIGVGPQALSAIVSGKVAGAAFPSVELVLEGVQGNVRFRFFRHPILKDIGNVAWAASPATIAARPDVLRRYSRALVKAAILIRENPELAARYFVEGSGAKVTDKAVADEGEVLRLLPDDLPAVKPMSKKIGYIAPSGIELLSKFLVDGGLIPAAVPAAVVSNQFIDFANAFDHRAFIAQVKGKSQ
jgi:NitT/TauT family transport system substrate-binding protein